MLNCMALIFCATLVFPIAFADKSTIQKQSFVSNEKKRTFYLFVPEGLSASEPVPLLLVLHGSNRNGLSLVEKWKDIAAKEKFIVAGLDAKDSSRWSTDADNPSVLRDLVDLLAAKYPINPRRVYLFGHSGGAVYAINLSMIESEYFAATAVHAGSWRDRYEVEVLRNARRRVPIAIWIGTKDPFFSVESARATRAVLVGNGFVAELTEIAGHDHWYYDIAPKINEAAWQFLKRYELTANPRYTEFVETSKAADANKVITEINGLQKQVIGLVQQANSLETQMSGKDLSRERSDILKLAGDEVEALSQAAGMARAAVQKAELAAKMRIGERNQTYMAASARYYAKLAEFLDAQREQAEILLSDEPVDAITAKRNSARQKLNELQRHMEELRSQAEKVAP